MIRPSIRIASALVALLLIAFGVITILFDEPLVIAAFAMTFGTLFVLPVFAGRRPPRAEELDGINADLRRFRTAMLGCFGFALVIYLTIATNPTASTDSLNSLAALGAAWWIVGFIALFFVAYFASRRAVLIAQD